MKTIDFIMVAVLVLVIFLIFEDKENFTSSTGLYNYFFESYMNPYPLPLNKFFSNDKEEKINE